VNTSEQGRTTMLNREYEEHEMLHPTRGTWIERFRRSLATQMRDDGVSGTTISVTRCVYGGYAIEIRPSRDDDETLAVFVGEDGNGWIGGEAFAFSVDDAPADAAEEVCAFVASRLQR
jgi:hypothetical protein